MKYLHHLLLMACLTTSSFGMPQSPPATSGTQNPGSSGFSSLFGFDKYLRLSPKTVSTTNGADTTVGVEFEYKRHFADISLGGDTELYFEGSGFLAANEDASPEKQMEFKLRFQVLGFGPGNRGGDFQAYHAPGLDGAWRVLPEDKRIIPAGPLSKVRELYRSYRTQDDATKKEAIHSEARDIWRAETGGDLTIDTEGRWPELEAYESSKMSEMRQTYSEFIAGVDKPWLSFELNAGVESDQDFANLQYVGGARLYGKWQTIGVPLDLLCEALRGYEVVRNYRNVEGGPYFWAGIDVVDATENEARSGVTGGDHDVFPRFSAGAYYRNELFSYGEDAVSLEAQWDFYAEIDAPGSIRDTNQDTSSLFKATLLFGEHMFLEYTDGRRPLDLNDSSAVSAGFRFGY